MENDSSAALTSGLAGSSPSTKNCSIEPDSFSIR